MAEEKGTAGPRSCLQGKGRAAVSKLTAVCCPPLPAVLRHQHLNSSVKVPTKCLLWKGPFAPGSPGLMAQLLLQCLSQVCAAPPAPTGAAAAASWQCGSGSSSPPVPEAPRGSPRAVPTVGAGQCVTGSLLLLTLTIGAFFPSCFLDHCTE